MKNIFRILFVIFVLISFPIVTQAACNIVIDGEKLICYNSLSQVVEPFVFEGTTYVPVRAIANAFDTDISWDQETKTVHLGSVGGNPVSGDRINIFFNGEEFLCRDVNNRVVYPILKEGTTYLPLRGISNLFNKKIYWDNVSQTATITTLASKEASEYLVNSVSNTAAVMGLKASLSLEGTLYYNGAVCTTINNSTTENYSPLGFSLSEFLPINYTENLFYFGNGNYFMVIPSDRFASNPDLQKTLFEQNTPTSFSSIYIYISTQGGYITKVDLYFSGKLNYNSLVFDEVFEIHAKMDYPENFKLPLIPSPAVDYTDNEAPVSAVVGQGTDASLISDLVTKYMENLLSPDPSAIFSLLHTEDYNALFKNKSSAQISSDISNIKKKLSSLYSNADGTYVLDSLNYLDASNHSKEHNCSARATINISFASGDNKWLDEHNLLLVKKGEKWYIDKSAVTALYNLLSKKTF